MPKPKNKTIFRQIPLNPFRTILWLVITNEPSFECSKLNQKHKKLELVWPSDAAAITEDHLYDGSYLPMVFDGREGFDVSTIFHEIIHCKNLVLHHAGVVHDPLADEWESYWCGWLAGEIEAAWKDYKKL